MHTRRWSGRTLAAMSAALLLANGVTEAAGPCERGELLLQSGVINDWFGQAVARAGDDLFVGVPGRSDIDWQGVVMRYERVDEWVWELRGGIRPSLAGAEVGSALAAGGDTLVLGSPESSTVHVFARLGGVWREVQTLEPSGADLGADFGRAVALAGDRLVVSAPYDQHQSAGALYFYERAGDGPWTLESKLLGELRLGLTLATDGEVAAASTRGDVFAFERQSNGWIASGAWDVPGDNWSSGYPLAVHQERIVIGNPAGDYLLNNSGAVYAYERAGPSDWQRVQSISSPRLRAGDRFGSSLGVRGDALLVASTGSLADEHDAGVNVFEWTGEAYVRRGEALLEGLAGQLSPALAVDDGAAFVGAPEKDGMANDAGVVSVFAWSADDDNNDRIPDVCLLPGDINEDGIVDGIDLQLLLDDYQSACIPGECAPIALEPDGYRRDCFGCELAFAGDALGVLEQWWDGHTLFYGQHHVFELAGNEWNVAATFFPQDTTAWNLASNGDFFAAAGVTEQAWILEKLDGAWAITDSIEYEDRITHWATTMADDTIIMAREDGLHDEYSLHFYELIDGSWTRVQELDPGTRLLQGVSAAGEEDIACIVDGYDDNVLIIERGADGLWEITHRSNIDTRWLTAVDVNKGRIVIGASQDDTNPPNEGAVYVLEKSRRGEWGITHRLALPGNTQKLRFGEAVALSGDLLAVGAPLQGDGVVHLYRYDGGQWQPLLQVEPPLRDDVEQFGAALALDGDRLAITAAMTWDCFYAPGAGETFVLHLPFDDAGDYDPSLCPCPTDVNNDARVDQDDLGLLLANFGKSTR